MMGTQQLLPALWRRRWTFVLATMAAFAAAAAITFTLPKVYTSQTYLLVTPSGTPGSDYEATQLTQVLTKTYAELLRADSVSRAVEQRLGVSDAAEAVSVSPVPQSQLLQLDAEARTPRDAQRIAAAFADVFAAKVRTLTPKAGSVAVAERASLPASPSRPRPLLYLALAAVLAVALGLAAALARERLDQRLRLDDASTEVLGLPIIGRLPRATNRPAAAAALAEASRLLMANLAFANHGGRPRTVAVLSASEQEGKSTCSLSVGRAATELGIEVLLVETDLRRPSLLAKLGVPPTDVVQGVSTSLVRPDTPVGWQVVGDPASPLEILPAGPIPPNPAALLGSNGLRQLDQRLRAEFDFVVYDTPPLSAGADATFVAAAADGVILVVDGSRTHRTRAMQAVEQLRRTRANVLGVVINRASGPFEAYAYEARGVSAPPSAAPPSPGPPSVAPASRPEP
jgi:polysaccharide biosynthesis transport protein